MSPSPRRTPRGSSRDRTPAQGHRRVRVGRHLSIAAALVAVVATAVTMSTATGTLALWNDSVEIPDATIEVGSMGLAIAAGSSSAPAGQTTVPLGAQTWATMLPGDVVGVPITLTNPGTVPVQVSAALDSAAAGQSDATFWLHQGTCPAAGTTGVRLTGQAQQLPGTSLSGDGTLCLQVALSSQIPAARQGTTIVPAFTLTFTAAPERTP
jgi:hypothetical protein